MTEDDPASHTVNNFNLAKMMVSAQQNFVIMSE
jgi:hypothetical protein